MLCIFLLQDTRKDNTGQFTEKSINQIQFVDKQKIHFPSSIKIYTWKRLSDVYENVRIN